MTGLQFTLLLVAFPSFLMGAIMWALYPLALLFELRPRGERIFGDQASVSVIIPAYNEAVVLRACVDSVLECKHRQLELILVDDGSTDDTLRIMRSYLRDPRVCVVAKDNGGKGSALNAGIAKATGEVLIFVDADGVFTPNTIPGLLAGFRHEKVGAVCGNDKPINVESPLTALLALLTHVGTGMTRRGLALVGMLPIVAGNCGAFRGDLVRSLGGFRQDTLGEDLELTWRVQFAGYDVEFAPKALVLAEVPSTLRGLWRQRVRWQRGLIQTSRIHRSRFEQLPKRPVDAFLPINLLSMLALPVLQTLGMLLTSVALLLGELRFEGLLAVLVWAGLGMAVFATVLSVALDRAWRDLMLLPVLICWIPLSVMMSLVALRALWLEARGAEQSWQKLERTGVRTVS